MGYGYGYRRRPFGGMGLALGIMAVILVLGFGGCSLYRSTLKTVTFTVDHRERVTKGDGNGGVDSYYLIWTRDGRVYKDADSWSFFKFNSSDIYGQMREGSTHTCKVAGWRLHLTSSYPNIISCEDA